MPLRMIMRYLLNNEQLVQKLADSYPIRRAAQLTAFMFHRGKAIGEDTYDKLKQSEIDKKVQDSMNHYGAKAQNFQKTFSEEIKDGFRKMNEDIERQKKR